MSQKQPRNSLALQNSSAEACHSGLPKASSSLKCPQKSHAIKRSVTASYYTMSWQIALCVSMKHRYPQIRGKGQHPFIFFVFFPVFLFCFCFVSLRGGLTLKARLGFNVRHPPISALQAPGLEVGAIMPCLRSKPGNVIINLRNH